MPKFKVLFVRFPYGQVDHPNVTDWLVNSVLELSRDDRFEVESVPLDDTPITMTRNRSVGLARQRGADILVWVDNDMAPDLYAGADPYARPFLRTTLDFMLAHQGPCAVAAPYCGPPPHENVYVFEWKNRESDHPNADLELNQFTREQAAHQTGIREVAALPTGLMAVGVRAFERIKPPYTYYEWKDEYAAEKASTEDVTLTRDLSLAGVPVYCNWDAWAGHWKKKCVGRPRPYTVDAVAGKLREALLADRQPGQRLVDVGPGGVKLP